MNDLIVRHIPPKKWWKSTKWEVYKDINIGGYTIPTGFVSDGVTSHRILWPLINPMGRAAKAAFLHDFLIQRGQYDLAHKEFKRQCKRSGVSDLEILAMYGIVRIYWKIKGLLFA